MSSFRLRVNFSINSQFVCCCIQSRYGVQKCFSNSNISVLNFTFFSGRSWRRNGKFLKGFELVLIRVFSRSSPTTCAKLRSTKLIARSSLYRNWKRLVLKTKWTDFQSKSILKKISTKHSSSTSTVLRRFASFGRWVRLTSNVFRFAIWSTETRRCLTKLWSLQRSQKAVRFRK